MARDPREVERRRLLHIRDRLRKGLARIETQLARYEHPAEGEKSPQRPTS